MRVDGKLGGRGPALCFCGGLGVDKPRSLGGLTPVRNKSETQCYHDPRRPGSELFGCSCALLFGPSVLSIFMSTCVQAASK